MKRDADEARDDAAVSSDENSNSEKDMKAEESEGAAESEGDAEKAEPGEGEKDAEPEEPTAKADTPASRTAQERSRHSGVMFATLALTILALVGLLLPAWSIPLGCDLGGASVVTLTASDYEDGTTAADALAVLKNRAALLNERDIQVTQTGDDTFELRVPAGYDASSVASALTRKGHLEFARLDSVSDADALQQLQAGASGVTLNEGTYEPFLTSDEVKGATVVSQSYYGMTYYALSVSLNSDGASALASTTEDLASSSGQIAVLLDGTLSVNESLLSGESDEIAKACGDELFSGSFVTAGQGRAMLSRVGDASYIMCLSAQAKQMKGTEQSEMIRSVNRIIKWVGIAVIPIAIILFCQSYFINHETVQRSVTSMVAAIIGMIPEGLYLLTTIALALSTNRLVRKKVLLHDMKSIETLARVDVLCVDKTGTITEPDMRLCEILPVFDAPTDEKTAKLRLCEYAHAATDSSSTMQALRRYADRTNAPAVSRPLALMPFSSAQKYGAIRFSDGTYLFGAPEVLLGEGVSAYAKQLAPALARGERVLAFCFCPGEIPQDLQAARPTPLLFVTFSNPLRQNAARTFSYFAAQGVTVKVISGDHPATVCAVAAQAGIPGAERFVDARTLTDEAALRSAAANYTVFGRVTPAQKQQLVRALQERLCAASHPNAASASASPACEAPTASPDPCARQRRLQSSGG